MKTLHDAFQELLNGTTYAMYSRQILECKAHLDLKELVAMLPNDFVVYLQPADFTKVMQKTMEMVPTYTATKNTIRFTASVANAEYPVKIVKMVDRYESSYDGNSAVIQTETYPGNRLAWICAIPAIMMVLDSEWTDVQKDIAFVLLDSLTKDEYAYLVHLVENLADVLPSHALIYNRLEEVEHRRREHHAKRGTEEPTTGTVPTTTSVTESAEFDEDDVNAINDSLNKLNIDADQIALLDEKVQKVCGALARRALYIVDRVNSFTARIHVTPTIYNKISADYLKGVGGTLVETVTQKKVIYNERGATYTIVFAPDHDIYLSENNDWQQKMVATLRRSVRFYKGSYDFTTTVEYVEDLKAYLDGENIHYVEFSENKYAFYIVLDCMDFASQCLVIATIN